MELLKDDLDESETLKQLAAGDRKAFEKIYSRYSIVATRVALQYLKRAELAEDLVQEIFSAVWNYRKRFTDVENFQAYFYTIATNMARQHLKRMAGEALARKEFENLRQLADNNIDAYLAVREYDELIRQALEELPAPHRRVFLLAKIEGLSHKDIAQRLELSQQTVKNYMVFALKSIKSRLRHHIASSLGIIFSLAHGLLD